MDLIRIKPKQIGDKGQRYVVKGRHHKGGPLVEFAFADTIAAARAWAKNMKSHPTWCDFKVHDRTKKVKKGKKKK